MKLLLIEDERPIADVIRRGLEEAHYSVEVAYDGEEGLKMALSDSYDLLLLDLMLPGRDGWSICRALRDRRMTLPILMLTARDAVGDRVQGLEMGADDYLPKPFDFAELLARVRALLRRDRLHKTSTIRIADLEIDTGLLRVTRAGREIPLTRREYTLLEALAANEGRPLSRDVILNRVWHNDESYSNTVDVHIGLLRKKIDADRPVKLIRTVHGVGYTLKNPDGEPSE
ncbi:MAG: response regulator transcription factor [Armatimonadetes bacterium]|nr:response regulator transcription factor [Armatimonadota bacterium]